MPTKKGWVDFKKVKESLDIQKVVEHYGLELRPASKGELVGHCPFHEDKKPSFRVNPGKGVFNCFGCSAKGNVLDLIRLKEGVDIRRAAILACEWFDIGEAVGERPDQNTGGQKAKEKASQEKKEPKSVPSAKPKEEEPDTPKPTQEVNKPLTFELKLEPSHPYLKERGVDEDLAKVFGIGFCSKGLMAKRIAIPIRNEKNELVAYAGRWPGEPPEGEPKYKLPPSFKKNLVLYNLNRVGVAGVEHLVIVEDCWSVLRLHKLGFPAVALLGRSLSPEQEKLLTESDAELLTLILDGDEAGREAQAELLKRLSKRFFVRAVWLKDDEEPDTLEEAELLELLKI